MAMLIPNNRLTKLFLREENLPIEINLRRYKKVSSIFLTSVIIFLFSFGIAIRITRLDELSLQYSLNDEMRGMLASKNILSLGQNFLMDAYDRPFHGALPMYIVSVFFAFFGISIFTSHLSSSIFGILAMVFFYLLNKELFDRLTATISLSFFSVSFLMLSFVNVTLELSFYIYFQIASSYMLVKYLKRQDTRFLFLGIFFTGLSLLTHLISGYYFLSLVLCYIVFKNFRSQTWRIRILGMIFFILLLSPTILNEFLWWGDWRSLTFDMLDNFPIASTGVNNLEFFDNLDKNIFRWSESLKGNFDRDFEGFMNYFFLWSFLVSLVWYLFFVIVKLISKDRDATFLKRATILIIILFMFFELNFTPFGFGKYHMIIIFPFIFIIVADMFSTVLRRNAFTALLVFILLAFYFVSAVEILPTDYYSWFIDPSYYTSFAKTTPSENVSFVTHGVGSLFAFLSDEAFPEPPTHVPLQIEYIIHKPVPDYSGDMEEVESAMRILFSSLIDRRKNYFVFDLADTGGCGTNCSIYLDQLSIVSESKNKSIFYIYRNDMYQIFKIA